jgi:hypothetical protein
MLKLRRFLCGFFGSIALFFLIVSFGSVKNLLDFSRGFDMYGEWPYETLTEKLISIAAFVLGMFIIAIPLVMTFLNGMAWWRIKKGKPSARGWAIAASLSLILSSITIILPLRAMWKYFPVGISIGLLVLCGVMIALGIAGLVAFGRRDSMAQPVIAAKPPRIAGDGTSRLIDVIVWIVGIAGYLWGLNLWEQWGRSHGLFWSSGFSSYLLILVALLLVVALHETGHVAVGLAVGMKPRAFIVGPFQWRIRDGRWKFQFLPAKFLSLAGAAGLVPTDTRHSRWREIWMGAAGPLANLFSGLIATCATLTAKGQPYEQYWEFLAYFSTLSLVVFATNLIPVRPGAQYSDGARIYQLLRGGPLADYFRAAALAASSTVTPLRSRDYDIEAIQRASRTFTQGGAAVFLRLVASEYFLDNGMISQAVDAFNEAEMIGEESIAEIPIEYYPELAFGNAFLRRDGVATRKWLDRMEALKPAHPGDSYWLAKSAMLWIDGRGEEARTAWERGNLLTQMMPSFGGNEFERYRFSLLRECMENKGANAAG